MAWKLLTFTPVKIIRVLVILAATASVTAWAQPGCPAVSFQQAASASLIFSPSTHLTLLRQLPVAATSPALFTTAENGAGVAAAFVTLTSGGVQTTTPVFSCTVNPWVCVPLPINLGGPNDQAVLELYGTGIRGVGSLADISCTVGAVPVAVLSAGPQSQVPGLDEVDVALPHALAGSGVVNVVVTAAERTSNAAQISLR
jgi:uncharacterized protein (TIGR03437 family)